jgi:hypothetical protein
VERPSTAERERLGQHRLGEDLDKRSRQEIAGHLAGKEKLTTPDEILRK